MPDEPCNDCPPSDIDDSLFSLDDFAAMFAAELDTPDTDEADPRGDKVRTWRGLLAPYGKKTGDGRRFAADALSNGVLPSALRWQREDGQGHSRSVAIGTLDHVEYTPEGAFGNGIIFTPDPEKLPRLAEDVNEALMLLDQGVIGPSVDLDSMEFHALPQAQGDENPGELAAGQPQKRPEIQVDKGRIRAATLVQIPAFAECGPFEIGEQDANEYAEQCEAWAAERDQLDTDAAEFAALLDELGDADSEDTFGARFDKLAKAVGSPALAAWIGRKKYGKQGMTKLQQGAPAKDVKPLHAAADLEGAMVAAAFETEQIAALPPAEWFHTPEADKPTPLTVLPDGRVFGHIADWKTCHTGFANSCVRAPKSPSGYAYFHTGVTTTTDGDIPIGKITLGTGHADLNFSHRPAAEHYDNSGTQVVEGRASDGKHGIWFSGRVIPGTSPERVAELKRSPLSGDWRPIGGRREMIAALAVNSGGFPIPRESLTASAAGQYQPGALVAAGVLAPEGYTEPGTQAQPGMTADDFRQFAIEAYRTFREQEDREAAEAEQAERHRIAGEVFAKMDETEEQQEPLRKKQKATQAAKKLATVQQVAQANQTQTGATGLAFAVKEGAQTTNLKATGPNDGWAQGSHYSGAKDKRGATGKVGRRTRGIELTPGANGQTTFTLNAALAALGIVPPDAS